MKYLLLICVDGIEDPEADAAIEREIPGWIDEMQRRGIRLEGHELQPPSDATTVRVRAGNVVLTDGPFAETKEYIGGFDIIDAPTGRGDRGRRQASRRSVLLGRSPTVRPGVTNR